MCDPNDRINRAPMCDQPVGCGVKNVQLMKNIFVLYYPDRDMMWVEKRHLPNSVPLGTQPGGCVPTARPGCSIPFYQHFVPKGTSASSIDIFRTIFQKLESYIFDTQPVGATLAAVSEPVELAPITIQKTYQ